MFKGLVSAGRKFKVKASKKLFQNPPKTKITARNLFSQLKLKQFSIRKYNVEIPKTENLFSKYWVPFGVIAIGGALSVIVYLPLYSRVEKQKVSSASPKKKAQTK